VSAKRTWTHRELVEDLARSRIGTGEAVVTEMGLGARYISTGGFVDVASFRLSWTNGRLVGWEVKVSRADFLADVRAGKWARYTVYFDRFFFAAPVGLLKKGEIPKGCGLIVRGAQSWTTTKASRMQRPDPDKRRHGLHAFLMASHPGPWAQPTTIANRIYYEKQREVRAAARATGRDTAHLLAAGWQA
jgi:hypothetical protein